jgi:hypothetical protein
LPLNSYAVRRLPGTIVASGTAPKTRLAPYLAITLLACLLSVLPAAIFADLLVPFTKWHAWYFPDEPFPKNPADFPIPATLRAEEALFRWLVVPPSWLWYRLGGSPSLYAFTYVIPGSSIEIAGMPPLALALSHVRLALPFWLCLAVVVYELTRQLRLRIARRRAA